MKPVIEVLCETVRGCIIAKECGADRIELNNATLLGGLTPTVGTLIEAKKHVDLPMVTMIRPRTGGFLYDEYEVEQMYFDAVQLLENGADGIVFGFLDIDRNVDVERTKRFADLAHQYGKEAIYHRAFDNVRDPYEAIEALIECGIERILTSGLQANAIDGVPLLKDLHEKYGDKIALLPGGGVVAANIKEILDNTGIPEIHGSFKEWISDPTSSRYSDIGKKREPDYFDVSREELEKAVQRAHGE